MRQRRRDHSAFGAMLDAAGTGQPGYPLVEICADRRVLIENHKGIRTYGTERVVVSTRIGCIYVEGEGLSIDNMTGQRLVIRGKIYAVLMERGEYCGFSG